MQSYQNHCNFESHNERIAIYFLNNFAQGTNCRSSHHSVKISALLWTIGPHMPYQPLSNWVAFTTVSLPLSSMDPTRAAWWIAHCHHQLPSGLQGLAFRSSQICFLPTSFWHHQWYWLYPYSHWRLLWPRHQQSRVRFCHFQQWWTYPTGSWSTPGVYEQHQDGVGSCQECLEGSQGFGIPTYDHCCHGLHGHSLQDPVRIPSRGMVRPPRRSPNHKGDMALCTKLLWSSL